MTVGFKNYTLVSFSTASIRVNLQKPSGLPVKPSLAVCQDGAQTELCHPTAGCSWLLAMCCLQPSWGLAGFHPRPHPSFQGILLPPFFDDLSAFCILLLFPGTSPHC